MLVQFSVKNFRSIRERQSLSMVAADYNDLPSNKFSTNTHSKFSLLRSAALYGPNASGKSTLIHALGVMKTLVLRSHKHQLGDALPVTPFKLDLDSRKKESVFEINFVENNVLYEYGFACNQTSITKEWLTAFPQGRAQKWFHREISSDTKDYSYKFSPLFEGGRKRNDWANETLENILFLSKVVQNNQEQVRPIFDWFRLRLQIMTSIDDLNNRYTLEKFNDQEQRQKIINFMSSADLGITDIKLEEQTFSPDIFPKEIPSSIRQEIFKNISSEIAEKKMAHPKFLSPKFLHVRKASGEIVEFCEEEESSGTRALFAFSGPWLDVIENELILVVDELDTSLHPLIVHHMIRMFNSGVKKAQLIFTTHDTTILNQKILRRDQIWFLEKNGEYASELYPLSDFSPRTQEALERGYLNGRYGGIPVLQEWSTKYGE